MDLRADMMRDKTDDALAIGGAQSGQWNRLTVTQRGWANTSTKSAAPNAVIQDGPAANTCGATTVDTLTIDDNLTIEFNRTRQAVITNELIEIISGAEAL